jgi:hypothetical protein
MSAVNGYAAESIQDGTGGVSVVGLDAWNVTPRSRGRAQREPLTSDFNL